MAVAVGASLWKLRKDRVDTPSTGPSRP
jgi:hypothetical protein